MAYCGETGAAAIAAPWIDERISTAGYTGEWSREVAYERATGRAVFDGGEYVYTPFTPSGGNYVTIEFTTTFPACEGGGSPGADAQAAVRLGQNGFQVWTRGNGNVASVANSNVANSQLDIGTGNWQHFHIGNISHWLDVAAHGVVPVAGREYGVQVMFNYEEGVYSVAVKSVSPDGDGLWHLLHSAAHVNLFPLAAKVKKVSAIVFDGKTVFRSLRGDYAPLASIASIGVNRATRSGPGAKIGPNRAPDLHRARKSDQIWSPDLLRAQKSAPIWWLFCSVRRIWTQLGGRAPPCAKTGPDLAVRRPQPL